MTWASYAFQMPDQTSYNMLHSSVFKCFAIQTGMVNNRLPICLLYYGETHLLAHKMSLFADLKHSLESLASTAGVWITEAQVIDETRTQGRRDNVTRCDYLWT